MSIFIGKTSAQRRTIFMTKKYILESACTECQVESGYTEEANIEIVQTIDLEELKIDQC